MGRTRGGRSTRDIVFYKRVFEALVNCESFIDVSGEASLDEGFTGEGDEVACGGVEDFCFLFCC